MTGGKVKTKQGRFTVKRMVLPRSDRYFVIASSEEGAATELSGTAKVKAPRKMAGTTDELSPESGTEVEFGALSGTTLKFKAKALTRGSGVAVQALISPSGATYFRPQLGITTKKATLKFTRVLDEAGTWRLVLLHGGGDPSAATYKAKLKHPKGAAFSLED